MGHPKHAAAGRQVRRDQGLHRLPGVRIKARGRLVEQQHLWRQHQGPDQGQALALAGRKAGDRPVLAVRRQAEPGDQLDRRLPIIEMIAHPVGPPAGLGRQIGHLATPLGRAYGITRLALQGELANIGIEIGDGTQQQALAGARGAPHGQAFARRQIERERPQSRAGQFAHFKHRREHALDRARASSPLADHGGFASAYARLKGCPGPRPSDPCSRCARAPAPFGWTAGQRYQRAPWSSRR